MTPDHGGAIRQSLEEVSIGIAAVGHDHQFAFGVHRISEHSNALCCLSIEFELVFAFFIALDLRCCGFCPRLGRGGRMGQINRNHSGRTVLCGKGGGKLDESLGEHEVSLEFGTEGISAPGHSVDTSSTLLAQGVVERYDHGHIGWKHPLDLFTDDRETLLWFDPAFRIHPVVYAPILVLASGCSDYPSDGAPAQTQ